MDNPRPQYRVTVSTIALVGYLVTVLAWELEIGLLLSHWVTKKTLDPVGQVVLVGLLGAGTLYSHARGKRDFKTIHRFVGRAELTGGQVWIVVLFFVCAGAILTWLTTRFVGG
jgi:hypothetical protein